ncbi:MAG: HAD family phosphatase, partial [Firmicutes bacterium]|nr:HAD family phosphatase [Bacillota bacterium]
MERKLLVTDLDGTLLDENKLISEPSREVLQAWVDDGNVLAIGTGRVLSSALAMRKALGLESLCRYVIACNGAQIYDAGGQADLSGSMLFERTIPFGVVERILDLTEAMDVHCHTYLGPYIVARRMTQALDTYRFHMHMPLMLDEDLSNVLKMDPPLMLAIEMKDRRKLEALQAELRERFPDEVMALFSSHRYLD